MSDVFKSVCAKVTRQHIILVMRRWNIPKIPFFGIINQCHLNENKLSTDSKKKTIVNAEIFIEHYYRGEASPTKMKPM